MRRESIAAAIESYLNVLEGADAATLKFFEGLWDVQRVISEGAAPYVAPTEADATALAREGVPVFAEYGPSVGRDALLAAMQQVGAYVADMAGLGDDQVTALRAADFGKAVDGYDLALAPTNLLDFIESSYVAMVGDEGDLAPAVYALVATAALTPLISGAASDAVGAINAKELSTLEPGTCPVCGEPATLSWVGDRTSLQGGDRRLWCGLCHADWPYGRVRCVRCGTRSSTALRYVHTEDDPGHRLHVCEECHGYIRTIFKDEVPHMFSPLVEEVVSSHLHGAAAELGFTAEGDGGQQAIAPAEYTEEPVDLDGTF